MLLWTNQNMNYANFSDLKGKTLLSVTGAIGDDIIEFKTDDGKTFRLYHSQDCCENVVVNDICGELSDLVGTPILQAEESESKDPVSGVKCYDSFTFTFYRLATIKGAVTIRWLGESNGYYSESVSFCEL